jgi:hypothetical protein
MPNDIARIVADFVDSLTAAIEADTLAKIREAIGGAIGGSLGEARPRRGRPPGPARAARPVRRGPVSPARRLQGQYLGALRKLKGRERNRIRAIAKKDGVAAALKAINKA